MALAVHGGPLPETTVRAVGATLAEALAAAHGQGLTHAGVSPAAVLLTADGPRLTCFGAVRAASADGEPRTGLPGLDPGALAPEQASGAARARRATSSRWARSSRTPPPVTPCPSGTNSRPPCAR